MNMKKARERGIALTTLVITIIILLILAGVSLNGLYGNKGMIANINRDKEESRIAEIKTNIQIEVLETQTKNESGIITLAQFEIILEKYGTLSGTDTSNIFNLVLTVTEDEDTYEIPVSEIWSGLEDKVTLTPVDPNDIVGPEISMVKLVPDGTKIDVTVTAQDISGITKYVYYIKKNTEPDSSYVEKANSASNTASLTDLEKGVTYIVKVELYDGLENKSVKTKEIKNLKDLANEPQMATGMTRIMFTDPTESEKGTTIKEGESEFDKNNWYSYTDKKWANAQTQDGSMWVWIPRFAYKVNSTDQTIDVKFLIGTTDNYRDDNGDIKTAQRQTSKDQTINTTADYTVHPAFTDESTIDYANGGWDKELMGIWVAKFEAGYASGNNDAEVKESLVKYSQSDAWVPDVESGETHDGGGTSYTARNWLDGVYDYTTTNIKYPVFQGLTYSMNYINVNDAFNISKALTESGNIYGLSASTDSHLMKNSEWGACSYLGKSQYGLGRIDITVNNLNLNSGNISRASDAGQTGVGSVYAVTGVTSNNTTDKSSTPSDSINFGTNIKNTTGDTAVESKYWAWNQVTGTNTSTTGTIYGVYDMSGGVWERTASYVPNLNENLKNYGKNIAYNGDTLKTESTKYTMAYSDYNADTDKPGITDETGSSTNIDIASTNNWLANTKIYGDGVRETSTQGTSNKSWYSDFSCFPALRYPFFGRGGSFYHGSDAGLLTFYRYGGDAGYDFGFRPVLVVL